MSLAIDIDKVSDVLLADGWHHVEFAKGQSTFVIDAYEFLEHREKEGTRSSMLAAAWLPG
jgi:hypothetical protein